MSGECGAGWGCGVRPSYKRILRCLRRGYCLVQWTDVWAMLDWWDRSPPGLPCPDKTEVSSPCFAYLREHGLIAMARTNDEGDVWWDLTDAGREAAS